MSTPSVATVGGAKLYIADTTTIPDIQAGWEALLWIRVQNITDFGTLGPKWSSVTTTIVDEEMEVTGKGVKQYGSMGLNLTDMEDAGRVIIEKAFDSAVDYPFKLQLKSGKIIYYPGKIMSDQMNFGQGTAAITTARDLQQTGDWIKVGASAYFTVSVSAGNNGSVYVANGAETTQRIASGGNSTYFYAVPDSGYVFSSWNDSSTTNPRQLTNVTADTALTASFVSA